MALLFVKDLEDKSIKIVEIVNIFFYTNGMEAPSGYCKNIMTIIEIFVWIIKNFPKYATVCEDYESRR